MEKGGGHFSGSEDFAKSLEPSYGSHSKREEEMLKRMREVAVDKDKKPHEQKEIPEDADVDEEEEKPKKHRRPPHHDKHAHHRRKRFELFSAIYLILFLAFAAFLAVSSDSNPFLVVVSLLPTLLTVIIAMVIYEAHRDNKNVLWVIPVVLIYAFHWYGSSGGGIVSGMNVNTLTAINIFLSFLYLAINYFLLQKDFPKQGVKVIVREADLPADLARFIASIEDKSKALNFAIGRVYNSYHGGTKELREKINMKQDWYDQFSQIPPEPERIDFPALRNLIFTIESRLKQLEKSEKEVFKDAHADFKNLVRDPTGRDKIIDVLDKNDKDPVTSYYEGALQFCGKIMELIKNQQVPEVANEYVERPDEDKKMAPRSSKWHKMKSMKKR